jgi:hypothetical protein
MEETTGCLASIKFVELLGGDVAGNYDGSDGSKTGECGKHSELQK